MPVIAHHQRAGANRSPDLGVGSLLTHPGLVLEPYFYGADGLAVGKRGLGKAGEAFLKTASASAFFFGLNGRGCRRVRPSSWSHRPIVFSCTSTENRRATSVCKSTQRQRTTLSVSKSGPLSTSSSSCAFCSSL